MSKFEKLNVDIRKEIGTSAARRDRLQNKVPAVEEDNLFFGTQFLPE